MNGYMFFERIVNIANLIFDKVLEFFNTLNTPVVMLIGDNWLGLTASLILGAFGVDIYSVSVLEILSFVGLGVFVVVHLVKLFSPLS